MGMGRPPPPSTPLFVVMLKGQCHEIHTIGMRFSLTDLEGGVVAAGEEDMVVEVNTLHTLHTHRSIK